MIGLGGMPRRMFDACDGFILQIYDTKGAPWGGTLNPFLIESRKSNAHLVSIQIEVPAGGYPYCKSPTPNCLLPIPSTSNVTTAPLVPTTNLVPLALQETPVTSFTSTPSDLS